MFITKLLFSSLTFVILSFLVFKPSFAFEFSDDFSSDLYANNWISNTPVLNYTWRIESGELIGEVPEGGESYLYYKNGFDLTNYSIDVDIDKETGVDQSIIFRVSKDKKNFYLIQFRFNDPYWPQDGNNIRFFKATNYSFEQLKEIKPNEVGNILLNQKQIHKISIKAIDSRFVIYYDDNLVLDYVDKENAYLSGSIGFYNWGGSYKYGDTINKFDNLRLKTLTRFGKKIVLIPGMGASWNREAIVGGVNDDNQTWGMTPFVNNYEGLLNIFSQNHLTKNEDYFVWNYDWRRPVGENVAKFGQFINDKIPEEDELDIVGHSMGGLIGRIWANENNGGRLVNKIISVGAPNWGSVEAYDAWNGAKIDSQGIAGIGLHILLELQKRNYSSNMEAIHNYSPSIKDLLPVFNFAKINDRELNWQDLDQVNDYLSVHKSGNLNNTSKFYYGYDQKTLSEIILAEPKFLNKRSGLWPDGEPKKYNFNSGDDTVLVNSANMESDNATSIKARHADLINQTLETLANDLGLTYINTGTTYLDNLDGKLVFFIGSPAELSVNCEGTEYTTDQSGLLFIDGHDNQNCEATLTGTKDGVYHLIAGKNSPGAPWYYYENDIKAGGKQFYEWRVENSSLNEKGITLDQLYKLIGRELAQLDNVYPDNIAIKNAARALEKRNISLLTASNFKLRRQTGDALRTRLVMDYLQQLWRFYLGSTSQNQATNYVENQKTLLASLNSYTDPTDYSNNLEVNDYRLLAELYEESSNELVHKNWAGVAANMKLFNKLAEEISD